jgi:hypothetical protein
MISKVADRPSPLCERQRSNRCYRTDRTTSSCPDRLNQILCKCIHPHVHITDLQYINKVTDWFSLNWCSPRIQSLFIQFHWNTDPDVGIGFKRPNQTEISEWLLLRLDRNRLTLTAMLNLKYENWLSFSIAHFLIQTFSMFPYITDLKCTTHKNNTSGVHNSALYIWGGRPTYQRVFKVDRNNLLNVTNSPSRPRFYLGWKRREFVQFQRVSCRLIFLDFECQVIQN